MPRFLDDNGKRKGKAKLSLLQVPMAEASRRMAAGESLSAADKESLHRGRQEIRELIDAMQERFYERIKTIAPWFDFNRTGYSFARLCGVLSQKYPGEPLSSWMDISQEELLGYVDALKIDLKAAHDDVPLGEDQDAVLYQKAIVRWNANAPGDSWANIAEDLTNDRDGHKAFSQAVKRFAKKNKITLRLGEAGSKRIATNRNE